MAKLSKKYREAAEKVKDQEYTPIEAFELLKEISSAKFDETVTLRKPRR